MRETTDVSIAAISVEHVFVTDFTLVRHLREFRQETWGKDKGERFTRMRESGSR